MSDSKRERTRAAQAIKQDNPLSSEKEKIYYPTGSTVLNCACSDSPFGGYREGTAVNMVGDSSSGKTFTVLSGLAEIVYDPKFDDADLYYDDVERADGFDKEKLFGPDFSERVQPPAWEEGEEEGELIPLMSRTVEDLRRNVYRICKEGRRFVYITDSLDALTSEEEIARLEEESKGKDPGGTYGTEKAKALSSILRSIIYEIEKSRGLLIIVSQTRQKIGALPFEKKKYRSGGDALTFYCSHVIWLGTIKKITTKVGEKTYVTGVLTEAKVTKNKVTGKLRNVRFTIYYSYGIDDIRSCIEYLTEIKHWKKAKGGLNASEFDTVGSIATLIKKMEEGRGIRRLKRIVGRVWNAIEKKLEIDRPSRFSK